MEQQDPQSAELPIVHQDWGSLGHDGLTPVHLPMAQPLEHSGQMPNLMPAITTLIMQITAHLSGSGNPQMALLFQPLVNMALNMQLQAWQQASAAAHTLPVALMEQMHLAMPQAAGGITIDANGAQLAATEPEALTEVAPAVAEGGAEEQQQAAAVAAAPAVDASATASAAAVAQQVVAAVAAAPRAVAPGAASAAGVDATAGIAPTYRETFESEGTDGEEEGGADEDDVDYNAKAERSMRRGAAAGGRPQRAQRARKRNKLLEEYLTDDEEGEAGHHHAKRRAHAE